MHHRWLQTACLVSTALLSAPAFAQSAPISAEDFARMRADLSTARADMAAQAETLRRQNQRIDELETRLLGISTQRDSLPRPADGLPRLADSGNQIERVGEAPGETELPLELAIADNNMSSVVTRKGQLILEGQLDYARADRNRALFRGIEVVESVLVGVFDINESRQDVLTASVAARYGLSSRIEIGARIPGVYRSNTSILTPIAGSTPNDQAATIDSSTRGFGLGDIELSARYQLITGGQDKPYLVANLQGVIPTGRGPFQVARDDSGRELEAATGAGFYGVTTSVTAIVPTDPVVLFGTLGYTFNLARDVDTIIPPVEIVRVNPGDGINASFGAGIAFNQRISLNFGYAHTFGRGTQTWTRATTPGPNDPGIVERKSRNLQIGRFLFGISYRLTDRMSLNWSVEVGATADATDLRTSIRIPVAVF
jgi:hypothetical protein